MSGPPERSAAEGRPFFQNVLWSWSGAAFSLASGLLLSPYLIRRLGDERYGIWALVFSFIDYFALVDLGLRSAVVKFSAHYRATGELDLLEEFVSTGLVYYSAAALAVLGVSALLARNLTLIFHVLPRDVAAFRFLTLTVGIGFAAGIVFSVYTAVLEACQRFDIATHIFVLTNGVRVAGCFAVLYLGHGLQALGLCVLAGQFAGYAFTWWSVRRLLPGRTFPLRKARWPVMRRMLGYGIHTFVANIALIVLNQDAPVLIGHFLTATLVGYFSFPLRLLIYAADLVTRLGLITGSKAAELTAHGDTRGIARMAVLVNRYCLMLFLPVTAYLMVFGRQLLQVWISPSFAVNCAPLIPALAAGIVIGEAAQYNSQSILYGMAKHNALAGAVAVEAVLSVAGLWYVIPRYGIYGAAWLTSILMVLSRGVYVPYRVSRHVGLSYTAYLGGIYFRPVLLIAPVWLAAWLANRALGQPATWPVALGGGALLCACYYPAAFFLGLDPEHRQTILASAAPVVRLFQRGCTRGAGGS
jgi:O-antigen/teichoic acid export membrane protein